MTTRVMSFAQRGNKFELATVALLGPLGGLHFCVAFALLWKNWFIAVSKVRETGLFMFLSRHGGTIRKVRVVVCRSVSSRAFKKTQRPSVRPRPQKSVVLPAEFKMVLWRKLSGGSFACLRINSPRGEGEFFCLLDSYGYAVLPQALLQG